MKKIALSIAILTALFVSVACSGQNDPDTVYDNSGNDHNVVTGDIEGDGWAFDIPEGMTDATVTDLDDGGQQIYLDFGLHELGSEVIVRINDSSNAGECRYDKHGFYSVLYVLSEDNDGHVSIDERRFDETATAIDADQVFGCGEITGSNGVNVRFKIDAKIEYEPLFLEMMESFQFAR